MTSLRTLNITTRNGIPFLVIDLKPGQYTNRARVTDRRRVEFFDSRYAHTAWGQFVSDYYIDNLVNRDLRGLCLQGNVPNWSIDPDAWRRVEAWLKEGN